MDQNQLIEKIVAEVVARMGTGKAPAASGASASLQSGASSVAVLPTLAPTDMAKYIDHTMLRPEAVTAAFDKLCQEALTYKFFGVCVNSCRVAYVARKLQGSGVKVCSVVGFPLGASATKIKVAETAAAIRDGAQEIDMVLNLGELRGGNPDAVRSDIKAVVETAHAGGAIVKVILETALLSDEQKVAASLLAKEAGADFVKTSTGFGPGGATAADVELMRRTVGPSMGVKASGGVRTLEDLKTMAAAGANRVGASASVKIVEATAA